MAINMNLLPPEYTATKGLAKVLRVVKSLGTISVVLFFVFTIGLSAFYLISSATLRRLNLNIDTLSQQIASVQKTEQQNVLIKDRLKKIKTIRGQPNIDKNLAAVSPYVNQISGSTALSELSMDSEKVDFSLTFLSNTDLKNFLQSISADKYFGTVTMTSFTYNPANGYLVGIRATTK